jgi:cyclopropane fatty-acyl-phospholipid synthase-like methyltransferase
VIESNLGGRFTPDRALDFGCGVGRIVIPLAERCGSVLGVDVADSMLVNARLLCQQRNLSNVRFARCDDSLEGVDGGFDLVHSYIVFQHVPPGRGLPLLERLLRKLNANGVGVIHVLYDVRQIHVLPTDHGGCLGLVLCFRNVPNAPYLV